MKYTSYIGLIASFLLIVICFLPWTWYPDINEAFTGFYSRNNSYGKPGKVLVTLALLSGLMFMIPRVWAKRINMFIGALLIAYGAKTYILFTACYEGTCPDKRFAIYLVLLLPVIIAIAAIFPDLALKENNGKKDTA